MLAGSRVHVNGDLERNARTELDPGDVIDVAGKSTRRDVPEGLSILHEDTDVIVVLKGEEGVAKLVERPRVERVEPLRPLDREDRDRRLTFDE